MENLDVPSEVVEQLLQRGRNRIRFGQAQQPQDSIHGSASDVGFRLLWRRARLR